MAITMVKVRAKITIGNLIVETPYVLSFNVKKSRSQFSTFDASLKIKGTEVSGNITGDNIVIEAGRNDASNRIFTGFIKQATISPCNDDPSYVIMNVSGADALSFLQGKKYTRRCRGTTSSWVTIESVSRPGLKDSKFKYQGESIIEVTADELPLKARSTATDTVESIIKKAKVEKSTEPTEVAIEVTYVGGV